MIERYDSGSTPYSLQDKAVNNRIQLLCEVSAELVQCDNPVHFVDSLFQRLVAHLPVDCYCQFSIDVAAQALRLVSYNGLSEDAAEQIDELAIPEGLLEQSWSEILPAVADHPAVKLSQQLSAQLALAECQVYPLRSGPRLLGLIAFGRTRPGNVDLQDVAILQAICHQISAALARRRIRSQLELERERFNALMDNIPAGVLLAEAPSGRIVGGNPQVQEILGANPLVANPLPSDSEEEAPLSKALRGERVQGHEYLFERPDGSKTWIRASGSPIRDRNGRVVGSVVTCYDIDQEKKAEAALRESEEHFRLLADSAPQIVWAANPQGRFDYFNRKWFESTGQSESQSYSRTGWTASIHPEDVSRTLDAWAAALRTGEPLQIETRYRDAATEQYRWHLVRAVPVRDAQQNIIRWLGTSTDIDDQKRAQESLRQADRSKDEFLAMLGHELRNPLAAVVNAATLLHVPDLDPALAADAREIIDRQLRNMSRMLDDMLDLARITQGKVKLQTERVNLVDIVNRAAFTSRPLIESRKHALSVSIPGAPVWLIADPTRLEQVVVNLLNNAAKYTEPGGRIWLTLVSSADEAKLTVRDNGVGMSPDTLSTAFELFAQAERSLESSQGGLGVGLCMVKSLVDMHGGSVRAHSSGVGQGSEFLVTLPLSVG